MRRRQHGISLVEVLVTLVSTSVGLLGIAALQLVSVRSNQESYTRLRATSLATSVIESIRANPAAIAPEFRVLPFNSTREAGAALEPTVLQWQREIDRVMPGDDAIAAGSIRKLAGSNVIVVTVRWGTRQTSTASARTYNELQLRTEL